MYHQFYPLMKQRAYSIVHNHAVIDDLIQEAFIKLIPKIPLLRTLSCYKTTSYIVYTLKHVCIDYIRKETRRSHHAYAGATGDVADQVADLQAATEENVMKQLELEDLERAMMQLSERDRDLLYFKYNMELKDKEIEKLLNVPAKHVRQYIARARQRLLRLLSEGGH